MKQSNDQTPLLECKNLYKKYGNKVVLKDINFSMGKGQIVGLLGRNGQGKTTLIKLINDLLVPTSGEILVNGERPGVASKRIISYLPERTYLNKSFTIRETLNMFDEFYEDFDRTKAEQLLRDLDLPADERIVKMSKGMQEKLQLALVMSRPAELYLLDEPLGGVDPATRDYILDTILSNFQEGASVLISTHLISDIERILDEVIILDHGEIVLQGKTDTLRVKEKGSIDEIFRRKFNVR